MKTWQKKYLELENLLKTFIETNTERYARIEQRIENTEEKLETFCDRVHRLESLALVNAKRNSQVEVVTGPDLENENSQNQQVNTYVIELGVQFSIII